MFRRFLIWLRFKPGARWVFDHMPALFRWGWLYETASLPPGEVYVPPPRRLGRLIMDESDARARLDHRSNL